MERLLARLTVRPPEVDDGVVATLGHISVEIIPHVFPVMEHELSLLVVVDNEIPHVGLKHLGHHLVPRVVMQLGVLVKHSWLCLDDPLRVTTQS
jgi:hypothetical protein